MVLVTTVVVLIVVTSVRSRSPSSLRATYAREVVSLLSVANDSSFSTDLLTESDLGHLPTPVRKYIRLSGAVGQPHIRNVRAQVRGRIRSGPDARWMSLEGEQHNFFDQPARLFYIDAKMFGVPTQVFHRYVGASATMRVTIAWTYPMLNASGPEMDVSETVTMFNDMCWIAAGTLVSEKITWEELDSLRVRATFTNAGHSVHAILIFNAAGQLVDFVSDDRMAASPDGTTFTRMTWSTPLQDYRRYGSRTVSARGEARWHAPGGEYTYIKLELVDIAYNVPQPP
jgi:hypothetical protein